VVVSRQPLVFSWRNSELIRGDLLGAVASLKADVDIRGILIPGSISVVQQLHRTPPSTTRSRSDA
jgi:hypothetical protein